MFAQLLRHFAVAAFLALVTLATPVQAESEYGTPAWAERDLTLRQGPGPAYLVVGAIPELSRITVLRCAPRWCHVALGYADGWVSRDFVGFGHPPHPRCTCRRLD